MVGIVIYTHNKHEQFAAEKRGGTAKAPHLFVQTLRLFLHKNALHFVRPCRGRWGCRKTSFFLNFLIKLAKALRSDANAQVQTLRLQSKCDDCDQL